MQSQTKNERAKKTLTSRDRQAIATKQRIYEVGINLIQQHGFDGIKINQIAKAAGVSVGTFYHYYTSKLDLFMDLYRAADAYYEETVAVLLEPLGLKDKIQRFFQEYCTIAENTGVDLIRKMYIPDNTLFLARSQGMHQVLLQTVDSAGSEKGLSLKKTSQEHSDDLFLIARGVIFDWALRGGEYDLKEKMKQMLDLYLKEWF